MTYLESAIREAIEKGGFEPDYMDEEAIFESDIPNVLLDPDFWRALGKARGWNQSDYAASFGSQHPQTSNEFRGIAYATGSWREVWHRLIDTIAAGNSTESFFKSLAEKL